MNEDKLRRAIESLVACLDELILDGHTPDIVADDADRLANTLVSMPANKKGAMQAKKRVEAFQRTAGRYGHEV